jgi:hypothetical protein
MVMGVFMGMAFMEAILAQLFEILDKKFVAWGLVTLVIVVSCLVSKWNLLVGSSIYHAS